MLLLVAYCSLVRVWSWTTLDIGVSKIALTLTPCQMLLRKIPQQWTNLKSFFNLRFDLSVSHHYTQKPNLIIPKQYTNNMYSYSILSPLLLLLCHHHRTTHTKKKKKNSIISTNHSVFVKEEYVYTVESRVLSSEISETKESWSCESDEKEHRSTLADA